MFAAIFGMVACTGDDDGGAGSTSTAAVSAPPRVAPPELRLADAPDESQPVGPPAGSPIAEVRRDCGSSEVLPAGGSIWLYCDTTFFEPGGRLRWFVNTSAAVATADEPLVMHERLAADGMVHPLLTPHPEYPQCDPGEGRFTWPTSGVVVPRQQGASEEVLAIFYENVCVVPGDFEGGDSGVAELELPEGPIEGEPRNAIEARIVEDRVFARAANGSPFGQASVRVGDLVYVYRCPLDDLACSVARAPADLDSLADPESYEVWTGSRWVAHGTGGAAVGPMEMPHPVRGLKPSVAWLEDLGVYVFVDHPAWEPSTVQLRVAADPWGPWSEPLAVKLPGCAGEWPDVCFAAEVHEDLSHGGLIALTWFDPTFPAGDAVPLRFATVGVEVDGGR
jgi:hypothetical protein